MAPAHRAAPPQPPLADLDRRIGWTARHMPVVALPISSERHLVPPSAGSSNASAAMRVLITGSDGYIGAILGPTLLEHGYEVSGIDCGFYRDGWLYDDRRPRV